MYICHNKQQKQHNMQFTKDDLTPRPRSYKKRVKTKSGRIAYTSMILPELLEKLRIISDNTGRSIADIIETVVTRFINDLERNETTK